MFLGILQFELAIPWARSLKDKRSVVKSLKDRLHRDHLVSVAEVAYEEMHNRSILGVAVVANSGRRCGMVLDRIMQKVRTIPNADLVADTREIIRGEDIRDELIWNDPEQTERIDPEGHAA